MEKLGQELVDQRLEAYPNWSQSGDALQRTFSFDDFNGAMKFVDHIAALAEESQHHPDIMIRYNKVTLTLSTHDAGGLTERDFAFAEAADRTLDEGG
jgi:4a-hydroxytetrahydrobiopterin dehydratase